ncbi:MAG: hypothetical protein GY820_06400 [Gammaproteobacteria bacterium]|nr:hypothetical protein [Gammaproteobacteria bacterium]
MGIFFNGNRSLGYELVMNMGPGEGAKPLSLAFNNEIMSLAFPHLFGGEKVNLPRSIYFSEYAKWLMMHVDSNPRHDVHFLFYLVKRLQIEAAVTQIKVALRKGRFTGKSVTDILANNAEPIRELVFKVTLLFAT